MQWADTRAGAVLRRLLVIAGLGAGAFLGFFFLGSVTTGEHCVESGNLVVLDGVCQPRR